MPWGIWLNFQLLMCLPVNLVHNRVDWHINILVNPSVLPEWVAMGRGHVADEKEGTKNGVVPTQNANIFYIVIHWVCILLSLDPYSLWSNLWSIISYVLVDKTIYVPATLGQ